jgi:hypothetical protein
LIADIARNGNNYIAYRGYQTVSETLSKIPSIPATPASSEGNHFSVETPSAAGKLVDCTPGTNGTSTAGNSAAAKLNALGALLVFVGAAFTLL